MKLPNPKDLERRATPASSSRAPRAPPAAHTGATCVGVEVIPILEVSLPTVVEVWARYVVLITL